MMYHTGSNQFSRSEFQIIFLLTASDNLFPSSRWGKYINDENKLEILAYSEIPEF